MVITGIYIPLSSCLNFTNMHRYSKLNDKFNMGFLSMKIFNNSWLNVPELRSFSTTKGAAECLVECIKQVTPKPCVSVNMETIIDDRFECTLLDTDKFHAYKAFKSMNSFTHFAIKALQNYGFDFQKIVMIRMKISVLI